MAANAPQNTNRPESFLVRPPSGEEWKEDNPCWGSKEENDLETLNKILDKSKCILFQNEDYICIDKPPDLRMDGCYRATVHKLTSYWYPSPLLKAQPDLLAAVKLLHQHNYLRDNQLRHIHQLDYPTSGVLLIGRTRKAAAVASEAFVNRDARKTYLALVHGHLKLDEKWPVLPESRLNAMETVERNYRKSRNPKFSRVGATFSGYLPANAMFLKWQSAMRERIKRKNDVDIRGSDTERKEQAISHLKGERMKKRQKKGTVLEPKEFDKVIDETMKSFSEEEITALLNVQKWRQVRDSPKWTAAIENMKDNYNSVLKEKNDAILNPPIPPLPRLFRIEEEETTESFYIHASCAQDKEKYRMILHPDSEPFDKSLLPASQEELESLDFKPALTRCTILARGTLNGHPVTKVKLEPRTGRRHQLRLHMVTVGYPIVGDIAYEHESNPKDACRRMCLHAHHLSLTLLGGKQEFLARDPFVEEEVGKIFRVVIPGNTKETE